MVQTQINKYKNKYLNLHTYKYIYIYIVPPVVQELWRHPAKLRRRQRARRRPKQRLPAWLRMVWRSLPRRRLMSWRLRWVIILIFPLFAWFNVAFNVVHMDWKARAETNVCMRHCAEEGTLGCDQRLLGASPKSSLACQFGGLQVPFRGVYGRVPWIQIGEE